MSKAYYEKDFLFDGDSAYLAYSPDPETKGDEIMLAFGDSSVMVIVSGNMPQGDTLAAHSVLKTLLTAYIESSMNLDSIAHNRYSIEVAGSAFRYKLTDGQMVYYVTDSTAPQDISMVPDKIMAVTLPGVNTRKDLHHMMDQAVSELKKRGLPIPSYQERELTVNDNIADETGFAVTSAGIKLSMYILAVGKADNTVFLYGTARQDEPGLMSQIRQIARTLRLK